MWIDLAEHSNYESGTQDVIDLHNLLQNERKNVIIDVEHFIVDF